MIKLPNVLSPPARPDDLDESAQWLAGEGAGSWFVIRDAEGHKYQIRRYSPGGVMECEGIFLSKDKLDLTRQFEITFPSLCNKVSIIQNGQKIQLNLMK